jgi:hypothetical protein
MTYKNLLFESKSKKNEINKQGATKRMIKTDLEATQGEKTAADITLKRY